MTLSVLQYRKKIQIFSAGREGREGFVYVPVEYNRLLGHLHTYFILTDTILGMRSKHTDTVDIQGTM